MLTISCILEYNTVVLLPINYYNIVMRIKSSAYFNPMSFVLGRTQLLPAFPPIERVNGMLGSFVSLSDIYLCSNNNAYVSLVVLIYIQ